MNRKLFFMKFDWQADDINIKVPVEVPVLAEKSEEINVLNILNGFEYILAGKEKNEKIINYINTYKEFFVHLLFNFGDSAVSNNGIELAINILKKWARLLNDDRIYTKIAQYYFEVAFPREAIKFLKKALKISPDNCHYITMLGVFYASINDIRKAERLWKKAVKLKSTHRKAWLNLTNLYNYIGNYTKNIDLWCKNKFIEEYPEIANQIAIALASVGRFNDAIRLFEKAKKNSELEIPYLDLNLAQAYLDNGNLKKALALYQEVYKRLKSDKAKNRLEKKINYLNKKIKGTHSLKKDKIATIKDFVKVAMDEEVYLKIMKSIEELKKQAEEEPKNPWVFYNLGNLYAQLGKFEDAKQQFEFALKFDEENTLIWHTLGLVYQELGNIDKALECIKRAVISRPSLDTEAVFKRLNFNLSLPYFNLGDIYIRKNRFDEAKQAFIKGLEIDVRSYLAHFQLGTIYEREEDFVKAYDEYKKSLALNKDFWPVYIRLTKILIKKGDEKSKKEAIELLKRLLQLAPHSNEAKEAMVLLKKLDD